MATKTIVVLGSLNMDLVMVTPRMPVAGETMYGSSFASHPGGKGLNQAVACQRLLPSEGWKTYMIGRVGEDEFANALKAGLSEEGIDISEIKPASGKKSGVALILVLNPCIIDIRWMKLPDRTE
jgi:ribokinase